MLGTYTIQASLGQGGFGITYLAHDSTLDTEVVIKESIPTAFAGRSSETWEVFTLPNSAEEFAWARDRFIQEARTLAKLNHRNIVRVLNIFTSMGTAYYVMPYVGGISLNKMLQESGPLPKEKLQSLLVSLLDALQYLHDKNLLHRDIKPANILLDDAGEPILIDFGASRQLSQHSQTVMESPGYTPFEQMQTHGDIGPWSDIYALGGTMYKLITGKAPVRSTDRVGGLPQPKMADDAELCQRYSRDFLKGIDKALALDATQRWQTAKEWMQTLPQAKQQTGGDGVVNPLVALVHWVQHLLKGKRRRPRWGTLSVILILLLGVYYFFGPGSYFRLAEQFYYGNLWWTQSFEKAAEYYEKAAINGDKEAKMRIADMYYYGRGVPKDYVKAAKWYRELAEEDYAGAQIMLGCMYKEGDGLSSSEREALYWYKKAAAQGNPDAQFRTGNVLTHGYDVKNSKEALSWFEKAAKQGHVGAQSQLGYMYQEGRGVERKDPEKAKYWYKKAAEQGDTDAENALRRLESEEHNRE